MPHGRGLLELPKLELLILNDTLRRIQESLDFIEGVRGDFIRGRWTFKEKALEYKDANGTVIHGFGDV